MSLFVLQKAADPENGGSPEKLKDLIDGGPLGTKKEQQPKPYREFKDWVFDKGFGPSREGCNNSTTKIFWRNFSDPHFFLREDEGLELLKYWQKFVKDASSFNLPGQEGFKKRLELAIAKSNHAQQVRLMGFALSVCIYFGTLCKTNQRYNRSRTCR